MQIHNVFSRKGYVDIYEELCASRRAEDRNLADALEALNVDSPANEVVLVENAETAEITEGAIHSKEALNRVKQSIINCAAPEEMKWSPEEKAAIDRVPGDSKVDYALRLVLRREREILLTGKFKVHKEQRIDTSIDMNNILLFIPDGASNDVPWLDYEGLGATEEEKLYALSNFDKPDFDFKKYPFRFHWELNTPFQETKLRNLDCFGVRGGGISGKVFFIHDRLLECWHDLIDKDLRILPTECYTDNGPVTEFHLVYVINMVDGLDKDAGPVKFPKATNDFMHGAQIAREIAWSSTILGDFYITPELVEKTLKRLHKKRLRDVYVMTFKEYHEWLRGY